MTGKGVSYRLNAGERMGIVADDTKTRDSSQHSSHKRLPLAEEGIMETLLLPFSPRFIVLTICAVVTALLIGIGIADRKIFDILLVPILIFGALTLLGVRDLLQKSHAVLRNYPISAHIRFLLEEIRPEMRQYFFESEKDGMPFSRDTRALVYQRAKMVLDKRPFGTQEDVYREGYEWMHHSMAPRPHADEAFRVTIGGHAQVAHLGVDKGHSCSEQDQQAADKEWDLGIRELGRDSR